MEILEYFTSEDKEHWLSEIGKSDWGAGKFLHRLLKEEKLKETVGENAKVLLLTDRERLISFCTFAEKDDIQPTELTPWIGWVYTFPEYRGTDLPENCLNTRKNLLRKRDLKISISPQTMWGFMKNTVLNFIKQ